MNTHRHLLLGLFFIALHSTLAVSLAAPRALPPQAPRFEDKLIVRQVPGVELHSPVPYIVFSPDGQHVAYLARVAAGLPDAGRTVIVVDNSKSEPFDFKVGEILFSEDSRKVAYTVISGGRTRIFIGGRSVQELAGEVKSVAFSANFEHYAYVVNEGGKSTAAVDGKVITGDFESIKEITLSPDGNHYLAAASNNRGREYVIRDGVKLGREFGRITGIRFGPRGESVAYSAEDDGQSFVVFNDRVVQVEAGFKLNSAWSLIYSDDGTRLMYAAGTDDLKRGFVGVVDKLYSCKYGEAFGYAHDLAMSPDNQYLFQVADARRVLLNGVPQPVEPGFLISNPAFSPNGKLVAFTVSGGGRTHVTVIRPGEDLLLAGRSVQYDYVSQPVFNVEGTKVAFGVRQGSEFWLRTLAVR